ncbi:protein HGH1 homolog [Paroedura picta]|uniref:protein HGH1 homolog n=1 Tax=Paroedura picta TaxID=143630 RepID=UPI004055C1C4
MEAQPVEELLAFLCPESHEDLRAQAVQGVLGLTGSVEGRQLLAGQPEVTAALLALMDDSCTAVACDACRALVNLAAEPAAAGALTAGMPTLLRHMLEPTDPLSALACAALANLTRTQPASQDFWQLLQREAGGLAPLVDALCASPTPPQTCLGPLLANLTQLPGARACLLHPARCLVRRLLPFTQDASSSSLCRGGVAGTLRNCCFDHGNHKWLLSDHVDILPFLLLPLAGPEEFTEEELEKLPLDLQYLPPEKQREPDPDTRKMLLEAILLLTATKPGRQLVRDRGAYVILRELHKWEPDPAVLLTCEKLIQVLIGDEPEPGMENLLEVEIPAEVEEQLQRLDREEEQCQQRTLDLQGPAGSLPGDSS